MISTHNVSKEIRVLLECIATVTQFGDLCVEDGMLLTAAFTEDGPTLELLAEEDIRLEDKEEDENKKGHGQGRRKRGRQN